MAENETYYSTSEVAERLRVSERAVRKYIDAGLLPGATRRSPLPKSAWRIPESAIDHFEEQREVASQPD